MKSRTLAHVVGYTALVAIAMAGTAQALPGTGTVDSGDIINGEVRRVDLANSAVNSLKVANGSLQSADIRDGAVRTADLADAAVTGPKLAGHAVDGDKVADGSLTGVDVADGSLTGAEIASNSIGGTQVNEASLNYAASGCRLGLVHSFSFVKGSASMTGNYADNGAFLAATHNCAGQPTQVRRVSTGVYDVRFSGDPAVLSTVTPWGSAFFASVSKNGDAFRVTTFNASGSPVEAWFQIMTY